MDSLRPASKIWTSAGKICSKTKSRPKFWGTRRGSSCMRWLMMFIQTMSGWFHASTWVIVDGRKITDAQEASRVGIRSPKNYKRRVLVGTVHLCASLESWILCRRSWHIVLQLLVLWEYQSCVGRKAEQWVCASTSLSWTNHFLEYLEDNLHLYNCDSNWEKWTIAFRQACLFEIAFFDAAMNRNLPRMNM